MVLADGGTMHVRPIRPDDGPLVTAFHERQSPESIYFRFFTPRPRLSSREVERFTDVDYVDRMAFVGLIGDDLVGVARYDRRPVRSDAEVAFFIDDEHHGRGIATVLLEYLAAAAREAGISGFTAQVLPQNRRMLSVFRQAGFEVTSRFSDGVIEVELAIEPTPEALAAIEERARVAESRSVDRILLPRSVAVIGASRRAGARSATRSSATCWPTASRGRCTRSTPAAATWPACGPTRPCSTCPTRSTWRWWSCPPSRCEAVVRDCARKRVEGLVVLSAGFAEADAGGTGPPGAGGRAGPPPRDAADRPEQHGRHQHRSRRAAARHVRRRRPLARADRVLVAVGHHRRRRARAAPAASGSASRRFVAVGNKADVSGNDLLQYWEHDDRTTWCCSTSSRSATRGTSTGSPAGCRGPSRSWR